MQHQDCKIEAVPVHKQCLDVGAHKHNKVLEELIASKVDRLSCCVSLTNRWIWLTPCTLSMNVALRCTLITALQMLRVFTRGVNSSARFRILTMHGAISLPQRSRLRNSSIGSLLSPRFKSMLAPSTSNKCFQM